MAATIPETEPLSFIVGDTVKWNRTDISDYSAVDYTLTYYFYNSVKSFSVAATASGTTYAIVITSTISAAYTFGKYKWDAYVSKSGERWKIDTGYIELKKDTGALSAAAYDYSSDIKKIFDAIEAVILGRASKDQESFTIAGRSLNRTPLAELIKMRNFYKSELENQLKAEAIDLGDAPKGKIRVRFVEPK